MPKTQSPKLSPTSCWNFILAVKYNPVLIFHKNFLIPVILNDGNPAFVFLNNYYIYAFSDGFDFYTEP